MVSPTHDLAKNLCFFLICSEDPFAVTAANESTTSFIVEITPPKWNPAIVFYEVETKCSHGCSIPASGQNLNCLLTGLEPATSYIIRVRTCLLDEGDCSGYVNTTAVTRPRGIVSEYLLFQVYIAPTYKPYHF